jgi:translation initiation factor IF-3
LQVITRANARQFAEIRLVIDGENKIISATEALVLAEDEGLDLVVVSPKANPPVCRIQDVKKLLYEEKKAKSKHTRTSELKEIQLKVNISDHDLETKLNAIRRFLERGDKVKVTVRLKGRERDTPERASQLIERVGQSVVSKMSRVPGPIATAILEPAKP